MSPAQRITISLAHAAGPDLTRAALDAQTKVLRARPTVALAALVTALRTALKEMIDE
jgi:hypothetical protein